MRLLLLSFVPSAVECFLTGVSFPAVDAQLAADDRVGNQSGQMREYIPHRPLRHSIHGDHPQILRLGPEFMTN